MESVIILDQLNAFGVLETLQKRPPTHWLCYGPKSLRPAAGVVVWMRPRGYHHYQTLTLLGVWAVLVEEAVQVMLGAHTLTYNQPFYNAEAYFHALRKDFVRYYGSVTAPPESPLWQRGYDAGQRLALRRELAAAVQAWRDTQTAEA